MPCNGPAGGRRPPTCSVAACRPASPNCQTLFPPETRGRRLRFVLQALDGSLTGASHREIAEALIDEPRVQPTGQILAIICVTASAPPFTAVML
ncbi:DNA -binding domain-containing protein [Mesorhizobium sp. AaZ16]|uniref:DNA -binding domain-containing protein n=1 Tax=Mesorhizobium sp. AaZ16 TaxID=3402289 RepID=UPI00374E6081